MTRERLRKIVARQMGREYTRRKRHQARMRERRRRGGKTAFLLGAGAGFLVARAYLERPLPGSGRVIIADEQPGPLSTMMAELMKGLLKDPQKKALADGLDFSLALQDLNNPELAATMRFKGSDVTVSNGVAEDADVYVGTELALLLSLASAGKGSQFLKWLQSEEGRKVVEAIRDRRFKIKGVQRKPLQMLRFQRLLTPTG
ncbi:hypothetical protein [Candidatus Solincola tengchongensis]|uniref:hypothetical protein n=1 Tax=Candidatus Solincola tengchongensis TaxID=2900693 RepID=UPI00257A2407|nr:hypothetical protein [Candidatus Solincola tengchongensis]